jgi:hypothetical protein
VIAVVADASVLVAELLRRRERELLRHPKLSLFVAQEQWEEAQHELGRRLPGKCHVRSSSVAVSLGAVGASPFQKSS